MHGPLTKVCPNSLPLTVLYDNSPPERKHYSLSQTLQPAKCFNKIPAAPVLAAGGAPSNHGGGPAGKLDGEPPRVAEHRQDVAVGRAGDIPLRGGPRRQQALPHAGHVVALKR